MFLFLVPLGEPIAVLLDRGGALLPEEKTLLPDGHGADKNALLGRLALLSTQLIAGIKAPFRSIGVVLRVLTGKFPEVRLVIFLFHGVGSPSPAWALLNVPK